MGYRDGKRVVLHFDTQACEERRAAKRKLHEQHSEAYRRAKYGPTGSPAPVVIRRLGR